MKDIITILHRESVIFAMDHTFGASSDMDRISYPWSILIASYLGKDLTGVSAFF